MRSSTATLLIPTLLSSLAGQVYAHSWLEQLQVIDSNGTFIGDYGYSRGYVARTDPSFNGDSMDYLLPALSSNRVKIDSTDILCHPSQRSSTYSSQYPALKVNPGGYVSMKYLENGHVTLPMNQKGKPKAGGTVFVFGTYSPKDDEKIMDVMEWTGDGTGGDKRGTLLAAQNFDDTRCYQLKAGDAMSEERQKEFPDPVPGQPTSVNEQWCETDLHVPKAAQVGKSMAVYWVWQWPTAAGADPTYPDGKDEYYTTCADLSIVSDTITNTKPVHTLAQQDPQTRAVSDFASRTAYTPVPKVLVANTSAGSAVASSTPSADAQTTTTSALATTMATTTTQLSQTTTMTTQETISVMTTIIETTTVTVSASQTPPAVAAVVAGMGAVQEQRKRHLRLHAAKFRA